jgi:probable dihydroxyacetone kinase regulator
MDERKDLTKHLIAESLKELVKTTPFEKLTIKKITDQAGLIRPAFYRYFMDKYEAVEWIFRTEVMDEAELLLEHESSRSALVYVFATIRKDREYYQKLFQITGQNSIEESMRLAFAEAFQIMIEKAYEKKTMPDNPILSIEAIAKFRADMITRYIREWVCNPKTDPTPGELADALIYMSTEPLIFT